MSTKFGFQTLSYECGCEIPTVRFGGGNIKVMSYLLNASGETGVGFSQVDTPREVNGEVDFSNKGKLIVNGEVELQFLFTSKESIDVLIDALIRAKNEL